MERAYRGAGRVGGQAADARPVDRTPEADRRLILGCGNFGGVGSAPATFEKGETLEQAIDLMDAAWEAGITWFDTADAYGGGRSEAYVGEWIRSRRPEGLRITTKTFNPMDEGEDRGLSPARVRRQIDTSLERLGVARVDLYLAHAWDPDVPVAEVAGVFDELVAAGKIGAYGLSNVGAAELRKALAAGSFAAVQDSYSLLDREVEEEVLPLCAEHGLWFQVHSPLMGGWLTGKYRRDAPPPEGSRMTLRPGPYEFLRTDAVFDALEALEQRGDPTTLALAWLLADERVSVVLGPRRPAQLAPGLAALANPLTREERAALSDEFGLVSRS
ncbi:MAG TPA: aldo/keto reductase [Gaiellaceae bacterium]|nr:aldo/keto reductase [Gaiellaceae bacterium]